MPPRARRLPIPRRFAALSLLLTLTAATVSPSTRGWAADPETGPIVGSDTSTLEAAQYGKPNQSRIWYNRTRQRWDGLVPKSDGAIEGSDHYIVEDVPGTQLFTTVELEDRDRSLPDAFWDDASTTLFVLGSHPSTSRMWTVDYDGPTDAYTVDPTIDGVAIPGITHDSPNHPGAIYVSPNGHVWVALMRAGALLVQRSVDRGRTWMASAVNLDVAASSGLVAWNHFVRDGTVYVSLFAAENAVPPVPTFYYYWQIDQNADPAIAASWTDESAAIPLLAGGAQADDHVGAARDDAENQYFVVKTQEGSATSPLINLFKRTSDGTWSQYAVTQTQETPEQSRPSLVVDREHATLTVFMSDTNAGRGNRLDPVPLSALDGVTTAPLVTLFSQTGKTFTDVITPRQPVDAGSGIVVLAHNGTDQTVWWADGAGQIPGGPAPCSLTTLTPTLKPDELKWKIKNVGAAPVTIGLVTLTWPEAHGNLREVKVGTKRIFDAGAPPPTVEIISFIGAEKDRRIDVGREREIRFKFQRKASTTLASFGIRVAFGAGCEVAFNP